MATGQLAEQIQDPRAMQDMLALIKGISPELGSGTKTETSTSSPDSASMANSNALLASVMGGSDTNYLDDLVKNILVQAKGAFGNNIMESIGSGNRALTDSTLGDAQAKAQGYATAAAASAKLKAINDNNQIAANIVGNQMRSTTTTKGTTSTAATPTGKLLGLAGIGLGADSLAQRLTGKSPLKLAGQALQKKLMNPEDILTNTDNFDLMGDTNAFSADANLSAGGNAVDVGTIPNGVNVSAIDNVPVLDVTALAPTESIGAALDSEGQAGLTATNSQSDTTSGASIGNISAISGNSFDVAGRSLADEGIGGALSTDAEGAVSGLADAGVESGLADVGGSFLADAGIEEGGFELADLAATAALCFITSAATQNGQKDKGEMLQAFRQFRDSYMTTETEKLSDIQLYYAYAPEFVKKINQYVNAEDIWNRIYKSYLVPILSYVKGGDNESAYILYRDMFYRVQKIAGY